MIDTAAPASTGDSAASAPSSSPETSPVSSSQAESAPASATTGQSDETPKGPIPYERFNEVNTRYSNLKWAEAYDPQTVQQQKQFFQWLDSDPAGAFDYLQSYLSRAGVLKQPNGSNGQQTQSQAPQPDVVIPETGQRFYSAEAAQQLAQWVAQEQAKPFEERISAIESDRHAQRAHQEAARQLSEAETWPHYKAHEAAILTEMERDHRLSLEGAYRRVVVPKIQALERQAVLSEIKQKSQASTSNPGTAIANGDTQTGKMSWSELIQREIQRRGGRI